MLYEGQTEDGLKVIESIRRRYDGQRRSPFNEAECGHHYARAMASWAAVLALSGFHYSGVRQEMEFAVTPQASRVFWSNGYAWGTFSQELTAQGREARLTVLYGSLDLRRLNLGEIGAGKKSVEFESLRHLTAGETLTVHF